MSSTGSEMPVPPSSIGQEAGNEAGLASAAPLNAESATSTPVSPGAAVAGPGGIAAEPGAAARNNVAPPEEDDAANREGQARGGLQARGSKLAGVAFVLMILTTVVVIGIGYLGAQAELETPAPVAWNSTIARLGIKPLYPLQEDMRVGDVYISVGEVDPKFRHLEETLSSNVFEGRAVKVGSVTLAADVPADPPSAALTNQPAEPARGSTAETTTPDAPVSITPGRTAVAFPGVTIRRILDADTRLGWFTLGSRDAQIEEVSIKDAEVASALPVSAYDQLYTFCADKLNGLWCEDASARALLSYIYGKDMFRANDGVYVFNLNISVVHRVYYAKSTAVIRYRANDTAAAGTDREEDLTDQASPGGAEASNLPARQANLSGDGSRIRALSETTLNIDVTPFPKPLAFGFQSVGFGLSAEPETGNGQNGAQSK